ncbi:transcriptional regulator [Streptomyces cirratus]|uniref:Transcriptional regulator n=1 Tax=Streptomyces cirratus TaxID=68187 RepID=A0ABQ3EVJ9_9ACTN|nr:transcriptional regulator [Streptomyces cirratus]
MPPHDPVPPGEPVPPRDPVPPVEPAPLPAAALSTGAVARRLGVSPTTLRSWERRYAIGPARREDGRHRRWTPADIARLEMMCRLTAQGVPPSAAAGAALGAAPGGSGAARAAAVTPGGSTALPLGEVRAECRGLARAAVRLDAPAVEHLLDTALAELGPVAAWEEVIAPTLHAVGRKWASAGERYVEVEHLLSWHVSGALRRLRPAPTPYGAPPVLLACAPDEQHSLPIEALTAALGERGLPALMFGPALPAEALREAVRRTGPRAAVLWAQTARTADRALARAVAGIEWGPHGARGHSALLLAGPGWGAGTPGPRTERLFGLRSGLAVIERLLRAQDPRASGAAPATPGACGS